jgi:hypothetical protein
LVSVTFPVLAARFKHERVVATMDIFRQVGLPRLSIERGQASL